MASCANTWHRDFTKYRGLVDVDEELLVLVEIVMSRWVAFMLMSPLAASRTY
jgi:hypothetical protein